MDNLADKLIEHRLVGAPLMSIWPSKISDLVPNVLPTIMPGLRAYAAKLSRPQHCVDIDDLLQDTFASLFTERMKDKVFSSENHLIATCRMILRRRFIDSLRRGRRHIHDVALDERSSDLVEKLVDGQAEDRIDTDAVVQDLLKTLSDDERNLLSERFVHRRSLRDIGVLQGVSIATVHRRIERLIVHLYAMANRREHLIVWPDVQGRTTTSEGSRLESWREVLQHLREARS